LTTISIEDVDNLLKLMEKYQATKISLPNGITLERPPLMPIPKEETSIKLPEAKDKKSLEMPSPEDLEFHLHNLGNQL